MLIQNPNFLKLRDQFSRLNGIKYNIVYEKQRFYSLLSSFFDLI